MKGANVLQHPRKCPGSLLEGLFLVQALVCDLASASKRKGLWASPLSQPTVGKTRPGKQWHAMMIAKEWQSSVREEFYRCFRIV